MSAHPGKARSVFCRASHFSPLICLTTTDLRIGNTTGPQALAVALWPLDEIAARHHRLAAFAESRLTQLTRGPEPSDAEQLTTAIELAAHFTAAMASDPLLPPELLPTPWPGSHARRLTADCWRHLRETRTTGRTPELRLFALYADALET
ncbi:PaaX family transcriptional regulator C-terminal domain-containing protein [Streptomyces sp. NPDC003027]